MVNTTFNVVDSHAVAELSSRQDVITSKMIALRVEMAIVHKYVEWPLGFEAHYNYP